MNDCERMIIDDLAEVKRDVKALLLDVNGLKIKSAIWGIVGGALFTIATIVVPLVWKSAQTTPVQSQVVTVDTTKVYGNPIH